MSAQREDGPAPPRLVAVRPGVLTDAEVGEVVEGDLDLDAASISGVRAERMSWTGRRRLRASRVTGLAAGAWDAVGASFVDTVLDGVEVTILEAAGSSWWNVEIRDSRIGSAVLYDSTWRGVSFTRCKLGYVNLRNAQATDVLFTDCVVDELDLARAAATRVAFTGSRVGRLDAVEPRFTDVDLRGARIDEVTNPEGLRGASITVDQLLDLAPQLALRLGIRVE